jgi:hypothetical protein
MRQQSARVWLAAALASAVLAGCQGSSAHTYPPDPLFASKRPIEARAETAPPISVASTEPALPPVPAPILAAAHKQRQMALAGDALDSWPWTAPPTAIRPAAHTPLPEAARAPPGDRN